VVAVMPSSTRNRRSRNSPYLFDGFFGEIHRSAAGSIWRWRTEFTVSASLAGWIYWMMQVITVTWAVVVVIGTAGILALVPYTRRYAMGRFWCLVTRHRLQKLCWEARLHTRSGRLPLILRIRPTEVGERAHVWCRAGICAEDFEAHTEEIRSACYARDARVARNKRHSQLITIDVIRRDTLHAARQVMPHVIPQTVLQRTGTLAGKARDLAHRFVSGIPRWLRRTPASN
jgi:hypothetical protein